MARPYLRYSLRVEKVAVSAASTIVVTMCAIEHQCMTVIALLSVAPVTEGSMSGEVAKAVAALEAYDVSYETNPMGTVIEADTIEELLAAVAGAHNAVEGDRVSTFLKIDDKRTVQQHAQAKVDAVEKHLGRSAKGDR